MEFAFNLNDRLVSEGLLLCTVHPQYRTKRCLKLSEFSHQIVEVSDAATPFYHYTYLSYHVGF